MNVICNVVLCCTIDIDIVAVIVFMVVTIIYFVGEFQFQNFGKFQLPTCLLSR